MNMAKTKDHLHRCTNIAKKKSTLGVKQFAGRNAIVPVPTAGNLCWKNGCRITKCVLFIKSAQ